MELWNDIKRLGSLYKEIDLVVSNEPILFVCKKESSNSRYLVMTYDSWEYQYVIIKVSVSSLLSMLLNKTTMEETFRNADNIYQTELMNDQMIANKYSSKLFSDSKLPRKGVFLNLYSDYIINYIEKLKQENLVNTKISTILNTYRFNNNTKPEVLNYSDFGLASTTYMREYEGFVNKNTFTAA